MKIAIVNVIKPQEGSRDGMTEYAYQLYERLKKNNQVELVYVTEKSKRLDNFALLYANTLFKLKISELAKQDYDVVHVANQELGYVARIIKKSGSKAKVITSIHDLMRMKTSPSPGFMQKVYNNLVTKSILDCFEYSDYLIFTASTVEKDAETLFRDLLGSYTTTLLAPTEEFRTHKLPNRAGRKEFVVGYNGAYAPWKNPIFVLKTANLLKNVKGLRFEMHGAGPEEDVMKEYKEKNNLSNVEILPFLQQKDFIKMYDSFDLFFYPTFEEGSSLPMINAQCRGLQVITHKQTKVDKEVTKYAIMVSTEKEAAQIIRKMKEKGLNKKSIDTLTRYARSFSWDKVSEDTLKVYRQALNSKKKD